jgi:hypothetical protein
MGRLLILPSKAFVYCSMMGQDFRMCPRKLEALTRGAGGVKSIETSDWNRILQGDMGYLCIRVGGMSYRTKIGGPWRRRISILHTTLNPPLQKFTPASGAAKKRKLTSTLNAAAPARQRGGVSWVSCRRRRRSFSAPPPELLSQWPDGASWPNF